MWYQILFLLIGLVILVVGADSLIRGAVQIARSFGISTLIIGLTIVAFGTSAPELFVSVVAAWRGTADVAVGNVIGSNIFNILMVIGCAAVFAPIPFPRAISRREMPIMLSALGLFWWFSASGTLSRTEGFILVFGIISYLAMNYILVMRKRVIRASMVEAETSESEEEGAPIWKSILFVVGGLAGLIIGAEYVVDNAAELARAAGISDLVIGVTLVAVGTSLPEFVTTVVAAARKESELIVGNAVGSNIFNVFSVIGVTASISPVSVAEQALSFDFPFMFLACFSVWSVMLIRGEFGRLEGSIMVLAYFAYVGLLFV